MNFHFGDMSQAFLVATLLTLNLAALVILARLLINRYWFVDTADFTVEVGTPGEPLGTASGGTSRFSFHFFVPTAVSRMRMKRMAVEKAVALASQDWPVMDPSALQVRVLKARCWHQFPTAA